MFKASKNVLRFSVCLSLVLVLMVLVTIPAFANIKMGPWVQNVTTNSIYVLAECDSTATATVKYGLTTSYGSTATTETTEATNGGSSWVHNVKLTGLAANTLYHYQVVQGTSTTADATFYTAVNPGTGFRMALMGDCRSNPSVHGTIASRIKVANPKISLYPGDLCNDANYTTWKNEFWVANELALDASVPFYEAPGNHEAWNTNTYAFSHGSGTSQYYSFDYGDTHVLVLSNYGLSYGVGTGQYNFAMSDLQASTKPWKIVIYHNPAYTYGSSHPSDTTMQAYANNIFIPNGVAMVVAGHNHEYERIVLNGLTHITMGGGGAGLYSVGSGAGTVKSESTYCYGIVDLTATNLTYNAYRSDGSLLDSFTLTKGPQPTPTPTTTPTATKTPTLTPGITPSPAAALLDSCDSTTGWTGSDAITLDTTNQREGSGCLSKTGTGIDWFKKAFSPAYNAGVTEASGYLHLFVYVSDVTKFSGDGQIEITSSGAPDVNEYAWLFSGITLVNGWNELSLKLSSAIKTGAPDLSAINYLRMYRPASASITCKVDAIGFTGTPAATPTNTTTPTPTVTPTPTASATPTPSATPSAGGTVLDSCDSTSGWSGSDAITLDTTNKQEGTGCLSKTGSGIDWFKKVFSPAVNTGVTEANGYLHLWIYVSDVSKFNGDGQIEITSSGSYDVNEYAWRFNNISLVNGWNNVSLKISSAIKTGTPNLSAINYVRMYRALTASITIKIDCLKFNTTP